LNVVFLSLYSHLHIKENALFVLTCLFGSAHLVAIFSFVSVQLTE
jgi:hypothetical protein